MAIIVVDASVIVIGKVVFVVDNTVIPAAVFAVEYVVVVVVGGCTTIGTAVVVAVDVVAGV